MRSFLAVLLSLCLLLFVPAQGSLAADPALDAAPAAGTSTSAPEGDATALEYGLIAALVAVVIITGLTALGTSLNGKFDSIATEVGTSTPTGAGSDQQEDSHEPGGTTSTTYSGSGDYEDGAHADTTTTDTSDFANLIFTFEEAGTVINAASATSEPNVKVIRELEWVVTLMPDEAPPGTPAGTMAELRMDFSFADIAWAIGGPVPQQDGVFEIEGPGGQTWGWSMEKNVSTGQLEITSLNGASIGDFVFSQSTTPVSVRGLEFQPPEVLTDVLSGPSFDFEIPYGVATDVTFTIRRSSHTVVPDPPAVPGMPAAAQALLALLLLGSSLLFWRMRSAA